MVGFIFAILGALFGWVPIIWWIIWVVWLIASIVGLFKTPRGFAIAGVIISFIWIIIALVFILGIGGIVGIANLMGK